MQWPVQVTSSWAVLYSGHCVIYVGSEVSVECPASVFRARHSVCSFKTLISIYQKTRCHSKKTQIRSFSTFTPTKSHKFKFPSEMFTADGGRWRLRVTVYRLMAVLTSLCLEQYKLYARLFRGSIRRGCSARLLSPFGCRPSAVEQTRAGRRLLRLW
jgi:hypothetical protein